MTVKNRVEVRIAGKDYTLMGQETDEYMQKVGLYVDKKMNEIMRLNSRLSTSMAAVLTALNVADDFFKVRESESSFKKELEQTKNELEALRAERDQLLEENTSLSETNTILQLELAKREAELREVRNTLEKASRDRR